jgi:hypothetical protein
MAIRQLREEKDEIFFCTVTCYNWLNLFEITNFYDEIYKWFDILKNYSCSIVGYVLMPNHLHFLVYIPENSRNLNTLIGNGKRFMAYEIITRLQILDDKKMLYLLSNVVSLRERLKGHIHKVFEPSFDSKICFSEKMILEKLDYMHQNPVSGKWNLVEEYTDYLHSSAKFYEFNKQGIYPVTHYKEIIGD